MDTIRLRTLTRKSKLDGKYAELTIQEIIDLKHFAYLRYCYYCYSAISFTEDILREIGVIRSDHDDRIEKPGTNPELHEKLGSVFSYSVNSPFNVKIQRVKKGHAIAKYMHYKKVDQNQFKKCNLQAKNHGH